MSGVVGAAVTGVLLVLFVLLLLAIARGRL